MKRAWALALGSLVVACRDEPPTQTSAAPVVVPAAPCGEPERVELRSWMATICAQPAIVDVRPLAIVPWTEREELGDGLFIEVGPATIRVAGTEVATEEDLRARLHGIVERDRAFAERAGRVFERRFVLAIDRDAVLRRVAELPRVLVDEGFVHGWLVFGSGTLPRTPPARDPELYARAVAELEAVEPGERATFLAKRVEPFSARCGAVKDAFGQVDTGPTAKRCDFLMDSLARALVECGCPEWQPELLAWLQILGGPAGAPVLVANTVELTPTKPERVAPDTTWAAFVATHDAPMRTLGLELAP